MVLGLHTFPPLGRVSQLKSPIVHFSVLLEVADHDVEEPWEICLWHSPGKGPWEETVLPPAPGTGSPTFLGDVPTYQNLSYGVTLRMKSSLQFTLKYRSGPTQPWIWARDGLGLDDGLVILGVESQHPLTGDLSSIIHGLNPKLKVRSITSQAPRTLLWTIEAPVGPSNDDRSAYADIELGTPWGGFLRYFALVRHSSAWLGPRHGKTNFTIDKDALLCSFLSHAGKHLVLLGISNVHNVVTLFRSSNHGPVMVHIRNDGDADSFGMVLAAVGDNSESAIAAAMYHARTLVRFTSGTHNALSQESPALPGDLTPKWMQNWYDGLGYCTWNALGPRLTEDKILNALEYLKRNNINITNLIIDDNWQDVEYDGPDSNSYGWKRFEAEPGAFPNGLQHTISQIRERFPRIEHIAVWHALLGYWGGISQRGDLARQYQTVQVRREGWEDDGPMTVIADTDVARFYDDFYRFLVICGVDGVKTDAQFMIDTWASAERRRELTNTYLDAWTTASLRHFGDKAISCMSQVPQILFRQQLSQNRPTITVRNSDDYFPDVPESHPWHIWANAHNTLFTQHLNVLPDWDMFQTSHENSGFHAAARCISGGPIYITDVPGEHDLELINQITALTTRGKTVILRPSVLGKTIDPYTGYDEDTLLKVGSYHGKAATGTPILSVFNTRPHRLAEIIPVDSFPGLVPSNSYVVRSHTSGKVTTMMDHELQTARLGVSLGAGGYDIFTAYPVTQFNSETNGRINVASLGLIDKMTGAAALIAYRFDTLPTGRVLVATRLKALGTLGLYISDLPHMSIERDFIIIIQDRPIPLSTVAVDQRDEHVLRIDVQKAWTDLDLSSGWSNEMEVKVYFDAEHC